LLNKYFAVLGRIGKIKQTGFLYAAQKIRYYGVFLVKYYGISPQEAYNYKKHTIILEKLSNFLQHTLLSIFELHFASVLNILKRRRI